MNHSESKLNSTLERRTSILDRLELHSRVGVPELSSEFGVSQVAIRNDFAQLEAKGLLIRTRGGAMMSNRVSKDFQLSDKSKIHAAEKRKIGRKATSLIENDDTVILRIQGSDGRLVSARKPLFRSPVRRSESGLLGLE